MRPPLANGKRRSLWLWAFIDGLWLGRRGDFFCHLANGMG
jgi:hypothetical protein